MSKKPNKERKIRRPVRAASSKLGGKGVHLIMDGVELKVSSPHQAASLVKTRLAANKRKAAN